ncbi:hypothetical protein PQR71_41975 [Paraburkholderia fungorum]|uniref:hypothetical protein n=1 Tax=Paraburkholderia fungorum TaxID=134537 RepID=UPI0038BC3853
MTTMFLAGFCLGIATLWIFLELISLAARRRAPTLHHRRANRDKPIPYAPPQWEREEGGVDYKWLGMTGSEQE